MAIFNQSNYKNTRIIPIALILIITAVSIAALITLARAVFFSGNGQTSVSNTNAGREALLNTNANRSVKMNVRGPIVADENFRSYQITISPSARNMTISKGYSNNPIGNTSLTNTTVAYAQFVNALDKANLAKGTEFTGEKNNLQGICATGYVYEFQILDSDKSVKQLWTSTCSGSRGSLSASVDQLKSLFVAQIPNAITTIGNIW